RIMGVHGKKEKNGNKDINNIQCLWNNLKAFLDAVIDSDNIPFNRKKEVWDIVSIGSDFEGYIDPVDDYSTSLRFGFFQRDLIIKITDELFTSGRVLPLKQEDGTIAMVPANQRYFLQDQAALSAAVHKLCFQNALDFAMRYL